MPSSRGPSRPRDWTHICCISWINRQILPLAPPGKPRCWWKWKSLSRVWLFATPWTSIVHGILQARILEWVAFSFSRGSSWPRDRTQDLLCRWILYQLSHKGSPRTLEWVAFPFSRGSSWPGNRTQLSCFAGGFFTSWAIREAPGVGGLIHSWVHLCHKWLISCLCFKVTSNIIVT